MNITAHKHLTRWHEKALVAFPLLIIVFMPRPDIASVHLAYVPMIGAFCATLAVFVLAMNVQLYDWRKASAIFFVLLLIALWVTLSELINSQFIRPTGVLTPLRPILAIVMLCTGVVVATAVQRGSITAGVALAGVVILTGQLAIGLTQVFGIPIFDVIYSPEKTRALGKLLRTTGTLVNPNTFGLVVGLSCLMALLAKSTLVRVTYLLVAGILIVVSGSRSMLLVFPFMIFIFVFFSKEGAGLTTFVKMSIAAGLFLGVAFTIIYLNSDVFLSYAELVRFIMVSDGVNLQALNQLTGRADHWANGWSYFLSAPDQYKWFVGLGSRDIYRVADNDYFFSVWRYGVIGAALNVVLYCVILRAALRTTNLKLRATCISLAIVMVVIGVYFETISGWLYPLLLLYLVGLCIGDQCSEPMGIPTSS